MISNLDSSIINVSINKITAHPNNKATDTQILLDQAEEKESMHIYDSLWADNSSIVKNEYLMNGISPLTKLSIEWLEYSEDDFEENEDSVDMQESKENDK